MQPLSKSFVTNKQRDKYDDTFSKGKCEGICFQFFIIKIVRKDVAIKKGGTGNFKIKSLQRYNVTFGKT